LPDVRDKIKEVFLKAGYEINEDINNSVSDMVDSDKELKDFIGKAPRRDYLDDKEKRLLDAAYKRTNGEIRNLTRTTAADLNVKFMNVCDTAWWKARHGVSEATAIREAIDEMSKYGSHIVYKSGKRISIESAIRMCVLTGLNQVNSEITLKLCADEGIRTVLVSSHLGARYTDKDEPANHQSWQGKVYTLSDELLKKFGQEEPEKNLLGKIKEFFQKFRKKEKYEDFETVTGYGTIEGLSGINCRHTFAPFYKGMKNNQKQYDSEENKKAYDLSQRKRAMERNIRSTKKQMFETRHAIEVANDEDLIKELKEKEAEFKKDFDEQNRDYTAFCKQNGLHRVEDRLYVSNKSQSSSGLSSGKSPVDDIIPRHDKPVLLGKIDSSDVDMVFSKLKEYEKIISNSAIENAIVITTDGSIIQCFGTLNGVYPEVDLGEKLIGAWVTHNHPIGSANEYSFSKLDINLFMEYNLKTLRGIDEKFIYVLSRNSKELDDHIDIWDLDDYSARHEEVISMAERLGIGYSPAKKCQCAQQGQDT